MAWSAFLVEAIAPVASTTAVHHRLGTWYRSRNSREVPFQQTAQIILQERRTRKRQLDYSNFWMFFGFKTEINFVPLPCLEVASWSNATQ